MKSVIFLAYADNRQDPLPHLRAEDDEVYNILAPRKLKYSFLLERDSFTSLDKIIHYLGLYKEHLEFFGYSGHAGKDALITEGGDGYAEGLAHLLRQCKNLKVVFLNGCSTVGQVKGLLDAGVKVVIAAHAPVGDSLAKVFATTLFQHLNWQNTINDAYEAAKGAVLLKDKSREFIEKRGIDFRGVNDSTWGIFWRDEEEGALNWKLTEQPLAEAENLQVKTILKDEANRLATKLLFIADKTSSDKYLKLITGSLWREKNEKKFVFHDLLGLNEHITEETYRGAIQTEVLSELAAADIILFLVNGQAFRDFWEKISWIKDTIIKFKKPFVFIKLPPTDEKDLEFIHENIGHPAFAIPNYDMFRHIKDAGLKEYTEGSFKEELESTIEKTLRAATNVLPEKLHEELLDFDLSLQSNKFKEFLKEAWRYNLTMIEGTDRCGQGLLLDRLAGYLPEKYERFDIDFRASEAPIQEEASLYMKLSEFLIQTPLDKPDIVISILGEKLKNQDILIALEDVSISKKEEPASSNLEIIAGFWKKVNALLPQEEEIAPPHSLYVFVVNRASHCGISFEGVDVGISNPLGGSIILQISPIDEPVFSDWYHEKKRRFPDSKFEQLHLHAPELVKDGYLSEVIFRICDFLNCKSVPAKLRIQ